MYRFFIKETSSADFTEITTNITRDSLKIDDNIQEKVNTAIFAMEANPVSEGNEIKIFNTTILESVSTVREITVDDISIETNKFRIGGSLWLGIGTATEEKVTIESVDAILSRIGISTASQTYSAGTIVGIKSFAGHITRVADKNLHQLSNVVYSINCSDYTKEFGRRLVNDSYENKTGAQIIDEFVREVINAGLTDKFTTASVDAGVTFTKFRAAFRSPIELMQRIADENGDFSWWVDYDRGIHLTSFVSEQAPISLTTQSDNFYDLQMDTDLNKVKNRQIVLGGLEDAANTTSEFFEGDGTKREWVLRTKFSDLHIATGTDSSSLTARTVLPDHINVETDADYFSNYTMQSVRAALTTSTLADDEIIRFRYKEKIPINVLDDDPVSIAAIKALGFGDGVIEGRPIIDQSIESRSEAENRARAELLKFSNAIINAKFTTEQFGLKSGQSIKINDPNRSVNQEFLIQKVQEEVYAGDKTRFDVTCASTLFGINELIQKLLKRGGQIELDENINIDLIKLIREKISMTSSFAAEDEEIFRETLSMTSSIIKLNQTPPFKYGPGGSPQGVWNLSSWS